MADDALHAEITRLENQFFQAMQDQDADAAARLTDEPCIITGAQGVARIDKKTMAGMMKNASWKLKRFEITDSKVERVSDDVAVIGYKVREDLIVDGKPLTMEAADSSTWVRKNGGWVCAMHTEALLGDPYGRDRRPA